MTPILICDEGGVTSVFLDEQGDDHIVIRLMLDKKGFERDATLPAHSYPWDLAVARAKRAAAFL